MSAWTAVGAQTATVGVEVHDHESGSGKNIGTATQVEGGSRPVAARHQDQPRVGSGGLENSGTMNVTIQVHAAGGVCHPDPLDILGRMRPDKRVRRTLEGTRASAFYCSICHPNPPLSGASILGGVGRDCIAGMGADSIIARRMCESLAGQTPTGKRRIRTFMDIVRSFCDWSARTRYPAVLVGLGLLLASPSLWTGLQLDDLNIRAAVLERDLAFTRRWASA